MNDKKKADNEIIRIAIKLYLYEIIRIRISI